MTKVVNFTVHRATDWKRKQHAVSEGLVQSARKAARHKGVAGFVLVAWNGTGQTSVSCDLSADICPQGTVPEFVYDAIKRALRE